MDKSLISINNCLVWPHKYECGLCDFEATNLENLEIHLVTCEIYQCDNCKTKFKSIKDIKEHIEEKYSRRYEYVHHLKLHRNNP